MNEQSVPPHFEKNLPLESSATFTKSHNSFAVISVLSQQSNQLRAPW